MKLRKTILIYNSIKENKIGNNLTKEVKDRHNENYQILMPKNWCFWTVVLEKTLESPLDCKDIKPVNPKRNQPWTVIGRTGAEDEAPMLWPPDAKSQFIGKDPGAGKDWGQEEKGVIEYEMVGWHHWLNRHEFEQTPGDSGGQKSLACYHLWDCRVRDDLAIEQQQGG